MVETSERAEQKLQDLSRPKLRDRTCYSCCTLLFEASYKVRADSGEGEIDSANDRRCKEFVAVFTVPQIPRSKSNKVCTRPLHRKQLNITERNFKRPKQVKGCTMLIRWKIQYYKVVISPQIDL